MNDNQSTNDVQDRIDALEGLRTLTRQDTDASASEICECAESLLSEVIDLLHGYRNDIRELRRPKTGEPDFDWLRTKFDVIASIVSAFNGE